MQPLDTEAMQHYIRHGYVSVQADMPAGFHDYLRERLDTVYAEEGNPGNNLLPRIPEIRQVFDHAAVRGALTSVLGPNYVMHPHRYGHCNVPGSAAQRLHKDLTHYSGDKDIQHHRSRWAMAFYYPQDVTDDMGPTSILPGTPYYQTESSDPDNAEKRLCGPAGTVTIVHFDIWHRATANVSDKKRYMLKFIFARTEEPPAGDTPHSDWQPLEDGPTCEKHHLLWRHCWNWLHGKPYEAAGFDDGPVAPHRTALREGDAVARRRAADALGRMGPKAEAAIPTLAEALADEVESVGLSAAYALGEIGEMALPALAEALRGESDDVRRNAAFAFGVIGIAAASTLERVARDPDWRARAYAVDALGELGSASPDILAALIRATRDENEWVRRHAADALGTLGPAAGEAAPELATLLRDEMPYVRINAATALMKLGPAGADAIPALTEALRDSDRYAGAFAALALQRIGTPEATRALLDHLQTARWCPITNVKKPY